MSAAPPEGPSADPAAPGTGRRAPMPAARQGLLTVVVGDERVAYDPDQRRAFRLNQTAGLVLDRCDGATPRRDVVADLAATFGADEDVVAAQVDAVLEVFAGDGLVGSVGPVGSVEADGRPLDRDLRHQWGPIPSPDEPSGPDRTRPTGIEATTGGPTAVGPTAIGATTRAPRAEADHPEGVGAPVWRRAVDSLVRVRSDDSALAPELERVFGSLDPGSDDRPHDGPGDPTNRVTAPLDYELRIRPSGGIEVRLDGRLVGDAATPAAALSYLQWHLNQQVIAQASGRILLHASAARMADGSLVVFPGRSNAGKSTLVAGLVRTGLGYVTDELVAVGPGAAFGAGYRKAISLDPGAWPLFPEVGPDLGGPDPAPGEWLVNPSALHAGSLDGPPDGPIAVLVFPVFAAGATTATEPLSAASALVELTRHCLNPDRLAAGGLEALASLARAAPAYRLTTGGLDPALAAVDALIRIA